MKYGSINGGVQLADFKNWIQLTSFRWGTGRAIGSPKNLPDVTKREYSEPSLSEIHVTKPSDVSSPDLFAESVAGPLKNDVTIVFTKTGADGQDKFLTYTLKNAGLSGFSVSQAGEEGEPVETLSLNYTYIEKKYYDKGNAFDLATMKKG
jgi:type VI secretion system secreted protein Hcp